MQTKINYPAAEPQYICNVCSEAITNPLCPFCLATEVDAWLTLYPHLRNEILPKIKKYLINMENKLSEGTNCIKCNKRASVCPYCFTEFILKQLNKLGANKIILNEFFQFFNFDIGDAGYPNEPFQIN